MPSLTELLPMSVIVCCTQKYIDPLCRTFGMQRQIQSFTTITSHPVGNLIGGRENRCASRHDRVTFTPCSPATDVGNGRESGTHYCKPDVVCFVVLCCWLCDCYTGPVRPGPPQTLSGASPTYFIPWMVCALIFCFGCSHRTCVE